MYIPSTYYCTGGSPRYIMGRGDAIERLYECSFFTTMNVFTSLTCRIVLRMPVHIEHSLTRCRWPHEQAHGPIRQGTHAIFVDIADIKKRGELGTGKCLRQRTKGTVSLKVIPRCHQLCQPRIQLNTLFERLLHLTPTDSLPLSIPRELAHLSS